MKNRNCIVLIFLCMSGWSLTAQESSAKKPQGEDTTRLKMGTKEIIIVETKEEKNAAREDVDADLEEALKDAERELEQARKELENARKELKNAPKEDQAEAEKEMQNAEKELREAELEMKREIEKMKKKQGRDGELKSENTSPEPGSKDKKKGKNSVAKVGLLDFDLGLGFLNVGSSIAEPVKNDLDMKAWGSWNFNFTFLPTKIYLGSRNLMLMTGLTWRIAQYEFKNKINFEPNKTLVYNVDQNIKKSEFITHHLQIPLCLYTESNRIKGLGRIGIGLGGYAGLLIHQEHELRTIDPDRFIETEEDFGFEEFRYGLTGRIDVGPLKFYANMDLNKLWKENDIKHIEAGIWIDF